MLSMIGHAAFGLSIGVVAVLVAAAIYFFVVLPMNMVMERRRRGEAPADPTTKKCPECLSEVPIAALRCAFCTQPLEVAGAGRYPR
jgi:large conductance mechanosensitive channel